MDSGGMMHGPTNFSSEFGDRAVPTNKDNIDAEYRVQI